MRDAWKQGSRRRGPFGRAQVGIGTGGGISCILEEGNVLERGGVAFSHVQGDKMPASATAHRPELAGCSWEAMGVSLVMHPRNPYAPTSHANVRMFMANKPNGETVFWFGGGMDLTPYYGFEEDAVHFHQTCKNSLASVRCRAARRNTKNGATNISSSSIATSRAAWAASSSTI